MWIEIELTETMPFSIFCGTPIKTGHKLGHRENLT